MKRYRDFISELTKKLKPEHKDSKVDPNYEVDGEVTDAPGTEENEKAQKAGPGKMDPHGNTSNGERVSPRQGNSPTPSKVLTKLAKAISKSPARSADKTGGETSVIKSTQAPARGQVSEMNDVYATQPSMEVGLSNQEPFNSAKHSVFAKVYHVKGGDGSSTKRVDLFHDVSKENALIKLGQQHPYGAENYKIKEVPKSHSIHAKYVAMQKQRSKLDKEFAVGQVKHLVAKHSLKHAGKAMDPAKIHEDKE